MLLLIQWHMKIMSNYCTVFPIPDAKPCNRGRIFIIQILAFTFREISATAAAA
jgi:hypothetical protein